MSVEAQLEKLRPMDGDVIVMRAMGGDPDPDQTTDPYYVLSEWVISRGLDGVLIVALGTEQDFRILDPAGMAEHGWYRLGDDDTLAVRALLFTVGGQHGGTDTESFEDDERARLLALAANIENAREPGT